MGATAPGVMFWARRSAIMLAVAGQMLGLGAWLGHGQGFFSSQATAAEPAILLVSRKRLLNETIHAKALLKAEIEMTSELQRRVDVIKANLTAEEQELTGLRQTLGREEFDAKVAQFNIEVRYQRREAQKSAVALQNVFRDERLKLVEAFDPLLDDVREAYGASVILDSDHVLTSDLSLDVTDEVIFKFNASVALPTIPDLDTLVPEQALTPGSVPTSE